ncbi:DUF349 domain-containing protein [Massilia sp. TS11]|uniref:DUF349 domain-containing protein n=1 Tax=Massilia sp. TS11 TaxID=2908003 RepID=UPI001EDC9048|nr:DUF349 domain-containing protein [Massilia sp. TS11]MCG2583362.1 DUF349 domain-containing protein [Massilia sp. TS11]
MFEFLKRDTDPTEGTPAPAADSASARAQQAEQLKTLAGDEAAAAAFVLRSEFSELRLAAAEHIHSRALLEQVHAAIRNTDRRVAKLLQGRLDALRHHDIEMARGQACIAQAQALLADDKLTPNRVAELDQQWSVIAAPELAPAYQAVHAALSARIEAQVALQRGVIDQLAELRKLAERLPEPAARAARLAELGGAFEAAQTAPEAASLPRSLRQDFTAELARQQALLAAPAAPAPTEAPAAAPAPAAEKRPPKPPRAAPTEATLAFLGTLEGLETALKEGHLHVAADLDKVLKDMKGVHLSAAQHEHLAAVRAELKRMNDWARWGGNISREELIKAAEQLQQDKPAMAELAKKVGALRERWKALDAQSGHAPKGLWERFDAACTKAYAPAAAHFKQLAEERHANAEKARALLSAAQTEAANAGADWRHLAGSVTRLRQAWQRLGPIDRKEKKKLDTDFAAVMAVLEQPLASQRQAELAEREALIAETEALKPGERHTLDAIRRLQERWQERARALPLERKDEQALWQRFRAACDKLFNARKQHAHAADAERKDHLKAKEALCATLEAAAGDAQAARILREVAEQWRAVGPVPRAAEARLDKRYQAAVGAIQKQLDAARRQASLAQASAVRDKLRLVQALENAIAEGGAEDDWAGRWAALAPLGGELDKLLQARFDAALAAWNGARDAYAATLRANRERLLQDVLRLEIVAGVDSGADFARERLKLQVEVLQSSLKSGQKPLAPAAQLLKLAATPALTDARTASRIEQLFRRVGKDGK